MIDKKQLCAKIQELYPDIGECGIDVDVEYDEDKKSWVVDLKKDKFELKTFLEDGDADKCMLGQQCVSLGWVSMSPSDGRKTNACGRGARALKAVDDAPVSNTRRRVSQEARVSAGGT